MAGDIVVGCRLGSSGREYEFLLSGLSQQREIAVVLDAALPLHSAERGSGVRL